MDPITCMSSDRKLLPEPIATPVPVDENRAADWHLVWGWWPMPSFVRDLLGEERCRDLVVSNNERVVENRFLIPFALELEHRRQAISSEAELDAAVTRVCAVDFDLRPAAAFYRSESDARWSRLARESEAALARLPKAADHPEVFRRELEAKRLPAGRSENIARMREILSRHSK